MVSIMEKWSAIFFFLSLCKGRESGWNSYSRTYVHMDLQLHQFLAISFLEKKTSDIENRLIE